MARKRDYKAEYAARQARSRAAYGVSYNEQRRLVERAKAKGLSSKTVRDTLKATKGKPNAKVVARHWIDRRAESEKARLAGHTVEWDPFAECINVDTKGDICGHLPSEHRREDPHPCTECTCPEYIHPDIDDVPDEMFWYH